MIVNKCSYCNKRKPRRKEWDNEIPIEPGHVLDRLIFCSKECKDNFIKKYVIEEKSDLTKTEKELSQTKHPMRELFNYNMEKHNNHIIKAKYYLDRAIKIINDDAVHAVSEGVKE